MTLNIAICDDDHLFLKGLSDIITSYNYNQDIMTFNYDLFSEPNELLSSITSDNKYNIFFLDIEMPDINGIDFAKQLRSLSNDRVLIIFISSYPEYMKESFNVHPFFYMQKPINKEKVFSLLEEISANYKNITHSFIVISHNSVEYPIDIDNIVYIEISGQKSDTITIHLSNNQAMCKGRLNEWKYRLSDFAFFECYRGILVNIEHIHFIKDQTITFDNGETVPISRKYSKIIKNEMTKAVITYFK
jgi:DNA-binding LytR/AlgR family response regulator